MEGEGVILKQTLKSPPRLGLIIQQTFLFINQTLFYSWPLNIHEYLEYHQHQYFQTQLKNHKYTHLVRFTSYHYLNILFEIFHQPTR